VLDNLTLLEQLTKNPAVQSNAAYLFAPQQAWLTHAYGLPDPDSRRPPDAGYNPPFGATVFFHLPDNYDGNTPATIQFADTQGKVIRNIPLHLATAKEKQDKEKATAGQYGIRLENVSPEPEYPEKTSAEKIQEKEAKLAAAEPGMNKLQWDLRYPYATEVKGFLAPIAAGGLEDTVEGPVVTPGTYTVTLDYGGQKSQQSLTVALDPRIQAKPEDLQTRLALTLKIRSDLDMLDKDINEAIEARDKLQQAVSSHSAADAQSTSVLAGVSRDMEAVVQLTARGSEWPLLYGTKLRDHLAYLAAEIGMSYGAPTAAQQTVFKQLDQETTQARQKLEADLAKANK
jgi:hypothetical protein